MLPHFARPNRDAGPVEVPPPPGFRFVVPPIKSARWDNEVELFFPPGLTAAQKAGLRYEKKVLAELSDTLQRFLHIFPTIAFEDANGPGFGVPDAVIVDNHGVCVIEVKSQHMPEAWWQLRRKYEPLVRAIHPGEKIHLVEICRSLDCDMPFPETLKVVGSIAELRDMEDGTLGVLQWRM